MDNPEIDREILDALVAARNPNDIILDLCEKYKLPWQEAETRVFQVQQEHQEDVTLRQAPLLVLLAFVTFIAGWALLALGLYSVAVIGIPFLKDGQLTRLLENWAWLLSSAMPFGFTIDPLVAIPLGVGLILGSLIGMRDVWAAILEKMRIWA